MTLSVVFRMWNRYQTNGNTQHRHGDGCAKATSDIQDRLIGLLARRNRFRNATSLRNVFQNATNVRVSTQTIRNRFHSSGLMARRPAIRMTLTPYHIQERLEWVSQHVGWTLNDWTTLPFADESKFYIDFTDLRARVWRARNERFAPVCVAEHDRYGKGSVMKWVGISMQGKTYLHIIENGTLTAVRYVNEILDVYIRPYAGAIGADFILMDDNARPHREHVTNQYLEDATMVRMDWPARSPDMNPIEHAWDMLQKAISARLVQPTTVPQLRTTLHEGWARLPQQQLRRLFSNTPMRCQTVIGARGHHTRY